MRDESRGQIPHGHVSGMFRWVHTVDNWPGTPQEVWTMSGTMFRSLIEHVQHHVSVVKGYVPQPSRVGTFAALLVHVSALSREIFDRLAEIEVEGQGRRL